jgi:hypothetical protein
LKAVDPQRIAVNPILPVLARHAAAGADNQTYDMDSRLGAKAELERIMEKLRGMPWDAWPEPVKDDDPQFWLDIWDFYERENPDDPLFQKYTRADLLDELARDPDDETEDDFERGNYAEAKSLKN